MKPTRVCAAIAATVIAVVSITSLSEVLFGAEDPGFGSGGKVVVRLGRPDPNYPFATAVAIQPDGKIVVVGSALIRDPVNPDDPSDDTNVEGAFIARFNLDGSLDTSFGLPPLGGNGVVLAPADFEDDGRGFEPWTPEAVLVQDDGHIVVAGGGGFPLPFLRASGVIVARFNPSGTRDRTFGRFPLLAFDHVSEPVYPGYNDVSGLNKAGAIVVGNFCGSVGGLALQPSDGKLLLVGGCSAKIVRLNGNGTPDSTFAGGSSRFDPFQFELAVGGLALQSDGKTVVAGSSAFGDFTLARVTTDARHDVTFSGDGRVFTQVGVPAGPDLLFSPRPVMIQPDGRIVVAGTIAVNAPHRGVGVVRYNTDGTLDPSFGIGGSVATDFGEWMEGLAAALQEDGKIVVAGRSIDATSCEHFSMVRYNNDGSLDDSFGINGRVVPDFASLIGAGCNGAAHAVAIQSDQKIVAAGSVSLGGTLTPTIATYLALTRHQDPVVPVGNTPAGNGVSVALNAVALTFDNVTQPGDTTVTTSATGPLPPSGFQLGVPPTYFDINTTAAFSGAIQVCIDYSGVSVGNEANLRLFHLEGQNLVDRTDAGYPNVAANVICGTVTSLSPFVVLERIPSPAELIVQLIQTLKGRAFPPLLQARLIAALENALANPRNVAGVCSLMDGLIRMIGAAAGRQIPAATAEQLIRDARAIQASLGC